MTKPEPGVPDPETPDPDAAGAPSPEPDAAGTPDPGANPHREPEPRGPGEPGPRESSHHQPMEHESENASAADARADDDAVWLDLVARLEEVSPPGDEATRSGPAGGRDSTGGSDSAGAPDTARGTSPAWTFRDFDPLGLAGTAPIELSAEERLSPASGTPAADGGAELPDTTSGPRDYESDDDGAFVPEEPPSLANAEPMTVLAWLGAVGGPIALLLSAMFWRSAPLLAILGMVAAFAVSVVFLIMKLPSEKDDNDDGARV